MAGMKIVMIFTLSSSYLYCVCILCVYVCVFIETAAAIEAQRPVTQSFLQLLARVYPSMGHRRPAQSNHQEVSCDSKLLIPFLLTLKYLPVSLVYCGFQTNSLCTSGARIMFRVKNREACMDLSEPSRPGTSLLSIQAQIPGYMFASFIWT